MAAHRIDEQLIDGRYARKEKLGRGGFGIVWRAHDTLLQRDVAIKEVLFPDVLDEQEKATVREKVLREARAAARLSHPALVTVFDVIEEDGRPLIVMELVSAPTLADRVARDGPLSDAEAAAIGQEVLEALDVAHGQGIVHRDVKPANVMVSDNGRVQLADFGVALIIDEPKVTSSGNLAGSPSYMAPEQAHSRPVRPATDLWGLGATLYFAVEGAPPFEKDGAIPTLTSVVVDDPRPMERATTLAPLLRDLLVKEPEDRPTTDEVRRRLAEVASQTAAPAAAAAAAGPPTMELDRADLAVQEVAEAAPVVSRPPPVAEPAPPAEPPPRPVAPPPPPPPAPAAARVPQRLAPNRPSRPGLFVAAAALLVVVALVAVLAARADRSPPPQAGQTTDTSTAAEEPAAEDQEQPAATAAPSRAEAVPRSWVAYRDPDTGFALSHPPDWSVQRSGTLTDFRDPRSGAYLRVDYTRSPGPSAEQAWLDFEPRFAAENPNYRRIRIEPSTFKGFPAAIWEFTYTGRGTPLHAVDLGFVTGPYGFALNFQTTEEDWDDMQDVFRAFQASFEPPAG